MRLNCIACSGLGTPDPCGVTVITASTPSYVCISLHIHHHWIALVATPGWLLALSTVGGVRQESYIKLPNCLSYAPAHLTNVATPVSIFICVLTIQ